jgi:hypothetical protein
LEAEGNFYKRVKMQMAYRMAQIATRSAVRERRYLQLKYF